MKPSGGSDRAVVIDTSTIIRVIVFAVAAYLLLQLIGSVAHQLKLIAIAAFLAMALNPVVTWMAEKFKNGNRLLATGIAYLIVLLTLMGLLSLVIPPLVRQTAALIQDVPSAVDRFMAEDTAASRAVENLNLESQVNRIRDDFAERAGDLSGPLLNTAGRIGGAVISVIMVLVLAFMMLVEGPLWIKKFISLQPASKRKRRERIAKKMYRVVTGYVNGQVLVAATGGVFALIALLIGNAVFDANVNAVALAGIVFVFALIPMIGTTIGAVLVVLITLLASLPFALAIGIFFIIYQQIENVTLQPLIQSKTNQLTPLTVLAAALLGIGAAGLIGAIAAIPIAGCIKVLLEERFWNNTPGLEEARQSSK